MSGSLTGGPMSWADKESFGYMPGSSNLGKSNVGRPELEGIRDPLSFVAWN